MKVSYVIERHGKEPEILTFPSVKAAKEAKLLMRRLKKASEENINLFILDKVIVFETIEHMFYSIGILKSIPKGCYKCKQDGKYRILTVGDGTISFQ